MISIVFLLIFYYKVESSFIDTRFNSDSCGWKLHKILGGNEAFEYAWPWMVSLQFNFNHACGGTLINSEWILTAAHCRISSSVSAYRVVMGTNNLTDVYSLRRNIVKFISHPSYNSITRENDIALLKLNAPVSFNTKLIPVCLPTRLNNFSGKRCMATGWGHTYSDGEPVEILRDVELPIQNDTLCKNYYEEFQADKQLCAGQPGVLKDTCQGDSGGPLVCYLDNLSRWYIAGIVSYGKGCQDVGVYTKVSNYQDWIDSIVKNN